MNITNIMNSIHSALKRLISRKQHATDFANYLGEAPKTRKLKLLEECKRNDVSVYIDDPSEHSYDIYSELRGVASEVELEKRLNVKKAVVQADRANVIAVIALIVSIVALVKIFL